MTIESDEDRTYKVLAFGLCRSCNTNIAEEEHTCPFGEEIHGDHTLCNCCDKCSQNCADDI